MELTAEQRQAIEQQKKQCPFCQIIAGKIPSKKVYEDDRIIVILDINPATPGHLLVMPKEHYPIMPLISEDDFTHIFSRASEISKYLRESMLATHTSIFIANGQAAGQQSQHFMLHVIPSDKVPSYLSLPQKTHEAQSLAEAQNLLANNLPLMMRKRAPLFPTASAKPPTEASDLARMIDEHPELREAIINNPDGVLAGLEENPSLKPVFEGVDIHALSKKLAQLDTSQSSELEPQPAVAAPSTPTAVQTTSEPVPRAAQMEDPELVAFIDAKQSLKEYLLNDIQTLYEAMQTQGRLLEFFQGTSPEEVRSRYMAANQRRPRFGGAQ